MTRAFVRRSTAVVCAAVRRGRWTRARTSARGTTRATREGEREGEREAWTASDDGRTRGTTRDGDDGANGRGMERKGGGKTRLDELTVMTRPELSRNVAQSWIAQGKVLVDGQPVTKAGTKFKPSVKIEVIAEQPKYVCRAGLKLEKALEYFGVDVSGLTALDSGLSTGGFTDCLLQGGARKVYGVDVGYGQVAEKIRQDERVVIMERTNLRYVTQLPDVVDIVTLDLSFISVLKVLPAICKILKPGGTMLVLIKPQFEARRSQIGSKGVVRDASVHAEVIQNVIEGAKTFGFDYVAHTTSPIKGAKEGNTEFLAHFKLSEDGPPKEILEATTDRDEDA
ncbi:Ribosomal RNA methyltransferase FtsJ domain [Ostreococcus tauri]|uniref:Ribosomal RNA methyltransferase FtsJ domain n=1 Tax=Ostreococcus tauri TaxID=70448 RepID=A0A090M830_OSTTA|nr:Ribosomal RNA methyltransferase FtsJ domain [Ostreococcus tauri]CEF98294.1 Ribosomal RNA methyltransferase FtsJ domain [Ostreococcus tauri]|eukprot:XP_022839190.1 Ribosomal RNA methyltransferase FtsJ domain [Ostreococcus tauri]